MTKLTQWCVALIYTIRRWLLMRLIGKRFAVFANFDTKEPTTLFLPNSSERREIIIMGGISSSVLIVEFEE